MKYQKVSKKFKKHFLKYGMFGVGLGVDLGV